MYQESTADSAATSGDCMVGLLSLELPNIRPNYEAMVRAGHLKSADSIGVNGNESEEFIQTSPF